MVFSQIYNKLLELTKKKMNTSIENEIKGIKTNDQWTLYLMFSSILSISPPIVYQSQSLGVVESLTEL